MIRLGLLAIFMVATLAAAQSSSQKPRIEVTRLDQSAFLIVMPGGRVIVTDPSLAKNPLTVEYRDAIRLGKSEPWRCSRIASLDAGPLPGRSPSTHQQILCGVRLADITTVNKATERATSVAGQPKTAR